MNDFLSVTLLNSIRSHTPSNSIRSHTPPCDCRCWQTRASASGTYSD